jgi:hypothetical protein
MANYWLLSRPGCHLCEEFMDAMTAAFPALAARVKVVDVDDHKTWRERFGKRIPVLVDDNGAVICEGAFDPERLAGQD